MLAHIIGGVNRIYIGVNKQIEYPKGNCLVISDDLIDTKRRPQIFDPLKDGINPLKDLNYRKICDWVDIFDALFSRGESTLTKDTGLDFIAEALVNAMVSEIRGEPIALRDLIPPADKKDPTGHIWAYGKMQRILRSPVLTAMLSGERKDFAFHPRSMIVARVNRAELGEFDAQVIAFFLMAQFKGQICLPDGGSYLRDLHISLLRENRLIFGVNHLGELPEKFRQQALLLSERVPAGALYDDAVTLAKLAGKRPDPLREDNPYNKFIDDAMATEPVSPPPLAEPRRIRNFPAKRARRARRPRRTFETKGAGNWSAP